MRALFCRLFGHRLSKRSEKIMFGVYDFTYRCRRCGKEWVRTARATNLRTGDLLERVARGKEQ